MLLCVPVTLDDFVRFHVILWNEQIICIPLVADSKMLQNMPGQLVIKFRMARNRLLLAIHRIQVNIVPAAMPMQKASLPL